MQVSKWDDTLAVRLPVEVVESLDLKEGDEIDIQVIRRSEVEAASQINRQEAIDRLRALRLPLPPGWKFDREEANAR